jgi:hypothetical protein
VGYVGEIEPLSELHGSVDGDAVRVRGKFRMALIHRRVRSGVAGRGVLNVEGDIPFGIVKEVNHDPAHACIISLFLCRVGTQCKGTTRHLPQLFIPSMDDPDIKNRYGPRPTALLFS